jgi:hypothetical protein
MTTDYEDPPGSVVITTLTMNLFSRTMMDMFSMTPLDLKQAAKSS